MNAQTRAEIMALKRLVEIQKARIRSLEEARSRDVDKMILLLNQIMDLKEEIKNLG